MLMRRLSAIAVPLAFAALTLPAGVRADDQAKPAGSMDMASMMPKPGPEHTRMQKAVGHWISHSTMTMEGMPQPMSWDGVEDVTSINGGLGIAFIDHGNKTMPMEGHGMETWDPVKKKYVGAWMDNMGPGLYTWEGTVSDDGKTSTDVMVGNGMTGQIETTTMVNEMQDDNHRTMKFYKGTDTTVPAMMTIALERASMSGEHKMKKGGGK